MRARAALIGMASALVMAAAATGWPATSPPAAAVTARSAGDAILGSWSSLGTGANADVLALAVDDTLYAGGMFAPMSGVSGTSYVAAWSDRDDTWHPLGMGLDSTTLALSVQDDTVYAGGDFSSAVGGANVNYVAAWSTVDDTWHPLGAGTAGRVYALAHDDTLYVGGTFPAAGGDSAAKKVAAWSNSATTWSPLGSGFGSLTAAVFALAVDDTIYVGGGFSYVDLTLPLTSRIAAWSSVDGQWHPLDSGVNSFVYALAIDDTLYAGGAFSSASGVANTSRVAAWSNVDDTWHPLGTGTNAAVHALSVDDTRDLVYAGGYFTSTAGGTAGAMQRVGVWDVGISAWIPMQWSDDSNGIGTGAVFALAADDSVVYVGGNFTDAGNNVNANNIAKWTWDPPQGSNTVKRLPVTLSGKGFIGVPATGGVKFGGRSAIYTRDDSTHITVTAAPGATTGTITVNGVGGWGNVGIYRPPPPPPPPVYPPSAPQSVVGVAGDASAVISWTPPASPGSFPVTQYQAIVTPGGQTCLASVPELTCEITGLSNDTTYTASVRALNGAGWGISSAPSNEFTPREPILPSITITGTRGDVRGKPGILVDGLTTGFAVGSLLKPWFRFPGETTYSEGTAQITLDDTGAFDWSRRTTKKISVIIKNEDGTVKSNRLVVPVQQMPADSSPTACPQGPTSAVAKYIAPCQNGIKPNRFLSPTPLTRRMA